jgi:hypothetical protein
VGTHTHCHWSAGQQQRRPGGHVERERTTSTVEAKRSSQPAGGACLGAPPASKERRRRRRSSKETKQQQGHVRKAAPRPMRGPTKARQICFELAKTKSKDIRKAMEMEREKGD